MMKIVKRKRRISKAEKVRRYLDRVEKNCDEELLCDSEDEARYAAKLIRKAGYIPRREKDPETGWIVGVR